MFYCTWRTVRGVLFVAYNMGDIMYGTRCVVHSYSVRTLYVVHCTQAYTYNPNYEWIEMNLVKKKTINSLTQWHSVKDKQRSLAILVHPVHSSHPLSPPLSPYPPQCTLISSLSLPLSPYLHSVHSYHLSLSTHPSPYPQLSHTTSQRTLYPSPHIPHHVTLQHRVLSHPLTLPPSLSPPPSLCHTIAQRKIAPPCALLRHMACARGGYGAVIV